MSNLAQIGVYGLGTMGSALALNMADNGFDVAVTNRETDWIDDFIKEGDGLSGTLTGHKTLEDFIAGIQAPRTILFMIPSGAPMDAMIETVMPLLSKGDTIIDGGNADFHLTRRRSALLAEKDLHFVGMGVSGGENGARHGPSMMVGGTADSWSRLKPIASAIAAKFEGDPCVDHLGPDGAGHFVKTVHNGIEYADMEMIAEAYKLLRYGAGWSAADIGKLMTEWDAGALKSYLVEITGKTLQETDPKTGKPVVDIILDRAGQKGTGRWTVIEAIKMGQSASAIEGAVAARAWSAEKATRVAGAKIIGDDREQLDLSATDLHDALMAARILGYAQGFRILTAAAAEFDWPLDYARIAEIWRAGCIIRSALLDDISDAFREGTPEGQLYLAPSMVEKLNDTIPALRRVCIAAIGGGYSVPALFGALAFYDTMRQSRGTADVIQMQRDYFGHHGFERVDAEGAHHGPWWD
ncbi:MAG: NADP-dependent phosphogluconate dehydrogenase [Paracoccaceae bacterium]|jgi:6-phosphogluconate dehydrogenase|nr:NADP-dependent phosphogluconate dehydrogenase [Paracoccaceae bacterium]MDG1802841.1 NADP-dependent phosphogluconate dehydrogenase [Paracoccaceae bacterium]